MKGETQASNKTTRKKHQLFNFSVYELSSDIVMPPIQNICIFIIFLTQNSIKLPKTLKTNVTTNSYLHGHTFRLGQYYEIPCKVNLNRHFTDTSEKLKYCLLKCVCAALWTLQTVHSRHCTINNMHCPRVLKLCTVSKLTKDWRICLNVYVYVRMKLG